MVSGTFPSELFRRGCSCMYAECSFLCWAPAALPQQTSADSRQLHELSAYGFRLSCVTQTPRPTMSPSQLHYQTIFDTGKCLVQHSLSSRCHLNFGCCVFAAEFRVPDNRLCIACRPCGLAAWCCGPCIKLLRSSGLLATLQNEARAHGGRCVRGIQ